MRECYTSKFFYKPPCLIAKIKLEKSVKLEPQKLSPTLGFESNQVELRLDPICSLIGIRKSICYSMIRFTAGA